MRALTTIVLTTGLLAGGGAATAEPPSNGAAAMARIFEQSDADADGSLSPDEFVEAGFERYGVPFAEFDEDGDGSISASECLLLYDRIHSKRPRYGI